MDHQHHHHRQHQQTQNPLFLSPHVLIFPLPLQGPVNCMLKLAELLCLSNIRVTFLNSDYIQNRLRCFADIESRFRERYPNFEFETLPDGVPEGNPRTADQVFTLLNCMEDVTVPLLREMVSSGSLGRNSEKPVSCIIADGIFSWAVEIAKEIGVPLLFFDTISPCGLWSYFCVPKLIEAGEFPFKGDDLDVLVHNVPGMEGFLRRRDLPTFCRTSDINDLIIQLVLKEDRYLPLAQGLIFNTFEDLEGPIISQFRNITPKIYAIGPIHTLLKTRLAGAAASSTSTTTSSSLWKEDRNCIDWLDKQPLKSVLFVSIGSLAVMSKEQLIEIWHGLVNSGTKFLWVRRPGSVIGLNDEVGHSENQIPVELVEGTKDRGFLVRWAPQEEVLAHPAIGGFLTHSGWNSTLESIVEGKPMICWPQFVDQLVNSRYVEEIWKIGLDMKDTCDRGRVEKMVRELMEERMDEFLERVDEMGNLARKSVSEGGSSYDDLERLIEDIRLMKLQPSI